MTTSFKVFENFQQQIAKKNYFYFCEVRSNLKLKKNFNWLKTWFFYFEKKAMFRIHDHDPYKKVKIWIALVAGTSTHVSIEVITDEIQIKNPQKTDEFENS